jgi:exodeoxyribonuclease VII large subunit
VRERPIAIRIAHARERLANLDARALRCERVHLTRERGRLDSLTRILDSISYKAVLARGFALVRGGDGNIRRRAGEIKPGEGLALVFADGEKAAHAGGAGAAPRGKKTGTDQGNLF